MSTKDWSVGQAVVIHCPEGRQVTTVVRSIGRKLVTVMLDGHSNEYKFDASMEPPEHRSSGTGSLYEMYTPDQSAEINYIDNVRKALASAMTSMRSIGGPSPFIPMRLLLEVGDSFKIERPQHLPKENTNATNQPIPSTTYTDHPHRPIRSRSR